MEGALDDSGPLQAADDKCVGLGSFCLHQLAFCPQPGKKERKRGEGPVVRAVQRRDKDPQLQTFLFITTITNSVGKGRCSGKTGKHLTIVVLLIALFLC